MPDHVTPVLLIGAGNMAVEYSRVLSFLRVPYDVIGRGEISARRFSEQTGKVVWTEGMAAYFQKRAARSMPGTAIVAVNVEQLEQVSRQLIQHGVRHILLEKPGGIDLQQLKKIETAADTSGANVYVAYNRRYLASVNRALQWIEEDGGLSSFHFEFTEKADLIAKLQQSVRVKQGWVLANSTHVIDLALFIGGPPIELHSYTAGGLDWHPHAAVFAGAGRTETGALFTYKADWKSAGNWSLELMTQRRRIVLNPLESVKYVIKNEREIREEKLADPYDSQFKPGLFRLVSDFLSPSPSKRLVTIRDQVWNTEHVYLPIQKNVRVVSSER